jgi:tetratricopeptide (TPR) repeat protein
MLSCTQCQNSNSLDSAFCKHCGHALPEDALAAARAKLDETVRGGYSLFHDGRTEEARMVSEGALATDPSNLSALSLKGMCHERVGEVAEALECFETVVARKPDSALDRIKLNQMRNVFAAKVAAPPLPNRQRAVLGAVAAFFLVASVGSLLATLNARSSADAVQAKVESDQGQVDLYPFLPQPQSQFDASAGNAQQPPVNQEPPTEPVQQSGTGYVVQNTLPSGRALPPAPSGGIGGGLPSVDLGNTPVRINLPQNLELRPTGGGPEPRPSQTERGIDPDPVPQPPTMEESARDHPGYIEINVRRDNRTMGGSEDVSRANGLQALLRTASNQFQLGNFQAAATTYERALQSGADPGLVNQRLAQCYERLGRTTDAVNAYNRAISGYEAALRKGENERTRAALETCRQAVRVIQGG